jgi:ADP-ribosylglycohydrolase
MSIDTMESLLACGRVDQDDLARRFAFSYRWSRGYGPGTTKLLKRIRRGEPWWQANRAVFPEGSFGNGAAMRVGPVGLFYGTAPEDQLAAAAAASAEVTHCHPLGREGAVLIALAVASARDDRDSLSICRHLAGRARADHFRNRLEVAASWLRAGIPPDPAATAARLGHGIAAVDSCVTAIYLALAFREVDFLAMLDFAVQVGGDVDTIAAMAGAVWGAARGEQALPGSCLDQLEERERLRELAAALAAAGDQGT